ncbi:MAG: DUF4301 family protein [Thermoanaerobaculia bacterium]
MNADDRAQLAESGIDPEAAEQQLRRLAAPPVATRLLRPATVGDGIERIAEKDIPLLLERAEEAREQGRFLKFVPASGAASRMFRSLAVVAERFPDGDRAAIRAAAESGDSDAQEVLDLSQALPRMALGEVFTSRGRIDSEALHALAAETSHEPLSTLFELFFPPSTSADAPNAWSPVALPKGLLPFHRVAGTSRSAFEEQLSEGLHYLLDANGIARYHFTVADSARDLFRDELEQAHVRLLSGGSRFDVTFSEQPPSSHALALDEHGQPARTADGRLLLRPSGHGALLDNLAETRGDLVFVKNIDNLLTANRHAEIARWKKILAGKLLEAISTGDSSAPWRVCGVVPNSGEPGGGPFWIAGAGGAEKLQIVESSEIAPGDTAQQALFRASTHFNPVDLVVSLRDRNGRPWALDRFIDPARALVAERSESGRKLRVFERPGLWNGAMGNWNTLLVEVPAWTFAPVKTALDLARAEHLEQGG